MYDALRNRAGRLGLGLMLALIVLTGASAQDVKYNFIMLGTDLSKDHTYRWVSIAGGSHPSQGFYDIGF